MKLLYKSGIFTQMLVIIFFIKAVVEAVILAVL